jgi:hypothetical protein
VWNKVIFALNVDFVIPGGARNLVFMSVCKKQDLTPHDLPLEDQKEIFIPMIPRTSYLLTLYSFIRYELIRLMKIEPS